jgi:hypothetical protein
MSLRQTIFGQGLSSIEQTRIAFDWQKHNTISHLESSAILEANIITVVTYSKLYNESEALTFIPSIQPQLSEYVDHLMTNDFETRLAALDATLFQHVFSQMPGFVCPWSSRMAALRFMMPI